MPRAIILGAGISGLAAGWALKSKGHGDVRVLESARRPGGKIRTVERDGFRFEMGPNAVQVSPEFEELCRAAGWEDRILPARPEAKKRFLVHRGRLRTLPAAFLGALGSSFLLARILTEPFRGKGPGPEESVAAFLRRRLGPATTHLVDAIVLGVYAGDPDELAVGYAFPALYELEAEHGSLLGGAVRKRRAGRAAPEGAPTGAVEKPRRGIISFPGGLGALAEHLASGLDIAYGHEVTEIAADDHGFVVRGQSPEGDFEERAERLISALPVHVAVRALAPLGPTTALGTLPHSQVAVLGLGFRRDQVAHPLDGFGFLAPHREGRSILGCLFPSSLFADRAPGGHVALTVMAGGRRRPDALDLSDDELVVQSVAELRELLGVRGDPVVREIARWRPGIPQPSPAAAAARAAAAELERAHPGLTVLGDWHHGVSLPTCVKAGWSVVD